MSLAVAVVAISCAVHSQKPGPAAFELSSGVIVAPGAPAVYLMKPEGGIDAVNPTTGGLLWTTSAASKPIGFFDGKVVAQAEAGVGVLDIVLLDGAQGGRSFNVDLALPPKVSGTIDDQLTGSLRTKALERDGQLFVAWDHLGRSARGAAPARNAVPPQDLVGTYRISVQSRSAEVVERAAAEAAASAGLPSAVQQALDSGRLATAVIRSGNVLASTEKGPSQLTLLRWNASTGAPLPAINLVNGPVVVQFPSADNRHLLVSQRVQPGSWDEYLWTIFSVETGERIGELPNHFSFSQFYVQGGNRMIYEGRPFGRQDGGEWVEKGLRLLASDLTTGAPLWERPLRDTTYRGPYPP